MNPKPIVLVGLVLCVLPVRSIAADAATVKADLEKIEADLKMLRDDQQKCKELLEPDRAALAAAKKQYTEKAAPFEGKIDQLEQSWRQTLKADREAIEASREQNKASIHAIEQRLRQGGKADKSDKAQREADEAALKAARRKAEDDVKALEAKRKSDDDQRDQELAAARAAMKEAVKDDLKAVKDAERKLHDDRVWEDKVEADKAILQADREKLARDKAAAGI